MVKTPAKGRKTPAKSQRTKPKATTPNPNVVVEDAYEVDAAETEVVADAPTASVTDQDTHSQPETTQDVVTDPIKASDHPNSGVDAAAQRQSDRQGAGFVPLLIGGVVAGGIGYAAAYLTQPSIDPLLESKVAAQAKMISELQEQIANIPVIDVSLFDKADNARAALAGRIDMVDDRLAGLLEQPAGDGSLSAANIAAYQQELENLRTSVEELRGTAVAELEAARATAASIEENAEAAARAAAGRAALARVQGAIETGAPMGAALDELASALQSDVPAALTLVRDGLPTLASLQSDFPDAARAALTTARAEGVAGESEGGFTSFLRNQFSVRSTAPKDGNSADAILSRAQAAVSSGRLTEALSEIATLPEVARAPLSDWVGLAETRVDAQAAAAALTELLNAN